MVVLSTPRTGSIASDAIGFTDSLPLQSLPLGVVPVPVALLGSSGISGESYLNDDLHRVADLLG